MKENVRRGLSQVFWNSEERRPRAPLRFAISFVLVLLFALLLGVVAIVVGLGVGSLGPLSAALAELASLIALVVAVLGVSWIVDRRRFSDLGVGLDQEWRREFGVGLAVGAAMVVLVATAILLTVGEITGTFRTRDGALFANLSVPVGLLVAASYFLAIGVLEELLFRGYLLVNVAEGARIALDSRRAVLLAVGVSAALFGLAHASNPSASVVSTLNITLFGLLLGGAYVFTDSLALSIGLHTGWNFLLGPIFGLPVSGLTSSVAVLVIDPGTRPVLSGGEFGPEAGLFALGALLVGAGLLVIWIRRTSSISISEQIAEPDLWTRS